MLWTSYISLEGVPTIVFGEFTQRCVEAFIYMETMSFLFYY